MSEIIPDLPFGFSINDIISEDVSLMGKILCNDEDRDVLKFLEILNCLSTKITYFWEIKTP